mmetsp:Transcript_15526/g.41748  ORF Transcript_15526/g.41748 Transcript_15526/m.41748 type:complete len:113 (+) Transcript_15526:50-388(+)
MKVKAHVRRVRYRAAIRAGSVLGFSVLRFCSLCPSRTSPSASSTSSCEERAIHVRVVDWHPHRVCETVARVPRAFTLLVRLLREKSAMRIGAKGCTNLVERFQLQQFISVSA